MTNLEFDVTHDAPQKNIARAGSAIIPNTAFVLSNLACATIPIENKVTLNIWRFVDVP